MGIHVSHQAIPCSPDWKELISDLVASPKCFPPDRIFGPEPAADSFRVKAQTLSFAALRMAAFLLSPVAAFRLLCYVAGLECC